MTGGVCQTKDDWKVVCVCVCVRHHTHTLPASDKSHHNHRKAEQPPVKNSQYHGNRICQDKSHAAGCGRQHVSRDQEYGRECQHLAVIPGDRRKTRSQIWRESTILGTILAVATTHNAINRNILLLPVLVMELRPIISTSGRHRIISHYFYQCL